MDVSKVHHIIQTFECGMGTRLNRRKSEVLPMTEWDAVFGHHGHPGRWQCNDFRHTVHPRQLIRTTTQYMVKDSPLNQVSST